jgi:hypothetical protein
VSHPDVEVYRYRSRPEAVESCLDLRRRAHAVYERHCAVFSVNLRDVSDGGTRLEIVTFPDEESARTGLAEANADPELRGIWAEFEAALAEPGIEEETFAEVLRLT